MNIDDDDGVLEAGRAIRPYLHRFVAPPAAAARLDRRLADELADSADRAATAQRVRELLEG